jgi:hypothetical protein
LLRDSPKVPASTREMSSREQHQRRGEDQHRAQPRGERQAGAEPDHHLGIAPRAVQREQDGDEQRERQQHRQHVERGEAEEGHHRVRGNLAARGVAEQPDQARGERDQEQRKEHRDGEIGEFAQQRAAEDHAILGANEPGANFIGEIECNLA